MTLAERLLRDGIPPSLLIDLYDLDGMQAALASEVLAADVHAAPTPVEVTAKRRLRSA